MTWSDDADHNGDIIFNRLLTNSYNTKQQKWNGGTAFPLSRAVAVLLMPSLDFDRIWAYFLGDNLSNPLRCCAHYYRFIIFIRFTFPADLKEWVDIDRFLRRFKDRWPKHPIWSAQGYKSAVPAQLRPCEWGQSKRVGAIRDRYRAVVSSRIFLCSAQTFTRRHLPIR